MKRFNLIFRLIVLSLFAMQAHAQVSNGTYRALSDANTARLAALGGVPLALHDGDLQVATFNPSVICPEMNNQMIVSYVGDFNLGTNFATAQYSHTFEKLGSFYFLPLGRFTLEIPVSEKSEPWTQRYMWRYSKVNHHSEAPRQ